jgi:hypothetical protein
VEIGDGEKPILLQTAPCTERLGIYSFISIVEKSNQDEKNNILLP